MYDQFSPILRGFSIFQEYWLCWLVTICDWKAQLDGYSTYAERQKYHIYKLRKSYLMSIFVC